MGDDDLFECIRFRSAPVADPKSVAMGWKRSIHPADDPPGTHGGSLITPEGEVLGDLGYRLPCAP